MTRERNVAIYAGDTISIRVTKENEELIRLENLRVKGVFFDIILAELPDGTEVDIFLNQEIS